MGHEEAQKLARRDTKHALLRVDPQVHLTKAREGFFQVLYQSLGLLRLHHDVVDVGLNVLPELRAQGDVHQPLKGRPCIAQPEWHACVAVHPTRG